MSLKDRTTLAFLDVDTTTIVERLLWTTQSISCVGSFEIFKLILKVDDPSANAISVTKSSASIADMCRLISFPLQAIAAYVCRRF